MQITEFETAREVRIMVVGDRLLLKTKTEINKALVMMVKVAMMKVRSPLIGISHRRSPCNSKIYIGSNHILYTIQGKKLAPFRFHLTPTPIYFQSFSAVIGLIPASDAFV